MKNAGIFIGVAMAARHSHVTSPISTKCCVQLRRLIRPNRHGKRCLRCLDGTSNHPPIQARRAKVVAEEKDPRQSSTNVERNTIVLRCARIGILMDRTGDAEVAIDVGAKKEIKPRVVRSPSCRRPDACSPDVQNSAVA